MWPFHHYTKIPAFYYAASSWFPLSRRYAFNKREEFLSCLKRSIEVRETNCLQGASYTTAVYTKEWSAQYLSYDPSQYLQSKHSLLQETTSR